MDKDWRGFITESKSYMNYPKCGRVYFWSRLPIALYSYLKLIYLDPWIRLFKNRGDE